LGRHLWPEARAGPFAKAGIAGSNHGEKSRFEIEKNSGGKNCSIRRELFDGGEESLLKNHFNV
jgi:hypothetical protein